MRAHYTRPVTDEQGDLLPNVQVSVFDPGTTDLISLVLYSTSTGNNVLTNPYVSATGIIDLYLDIPARVRFGLVQGGLPMQLYDDVDILAAGSDSQHSGAGTNSLVLGVSATSAGNGSVAMGPSASSGGTGSSALGPLTNAVGDYSTAVGSGAASSGTGGVAAGRDSSASGVSSTALGHGAQAADQSAVALGDGATAPYAHSSAVGPGAETTQPNQVVLGTPADIVEIPAGSAVILSDTNGVRWKVTINTDGSLNTQAA